MTNTNCLAGFQCPNCKSLGPFDIEIKTSFSVSDDGVGDQTGDNEWTDDSSCQCEECGQLGTVGSFQEGGAA